MTSPTAESLRAWLVSRVAALRSIDARTIDVRERFSRYGLDSLGAGRLIGELALLLDRPLSPTLVWELPTINALAAHLTGAQESAAAPVEAAGTRDAPEPIAIVGMACRFPKAPDLASFWRLLADGVDAITEVPKDRWDAAALFDPDPNTPSKLTTRWGGFLEHIDRFDPQFFGISPREAVQMDPQQRLVLELAWEALEDAGIPPHGLKDSRTGVFMGAMWNDYAKVTAGETSHVTQHTATGQDLSIIPARVSYVLGLRGPSLAVNTACSSSIVAVHLARQSLLSGESTLALAGGVNLIIGPSSTLAMSKFGAMAPDGRSKAFDARANGYVRGEGGGVVVLERLSRAIALGHPIQAIILGSALNNDGFSNGLTAPSPKAQELVVGDACASAGVEPGRIQYVETHGTGTMLGDPIEAGALGAALGGERSEERPLLIGSVKTNVGHLESAAGMAGLIKVVLSLQHRQIPPSLHFQSPNPHIPFEALHLRVQDSLTSWPEMDARALAGVSSFGFGGTNSHIILEGAPVGEVHVLPLAAQSFEGLLERASRLQAIALGADPRPSLGALCAAAAAHLASDEHRAAITVRSHDELAESLDALLATNPRAGTSCGIASADRPGPVFVFAGQGSQWVGMGRTLLRDEPAFQASIARCDQAMRPYLGASLLTVLAGDDRAWLEDTALVQPAIFAVQVALAELLRSWGIEPAVVVGQSMGEVAAARVAGCLELDDAVRIICARSRLVKRARGQGGMASVELSLDDARRALVGREAALSVAVSSSPTSTVLSGDVAELDALLAELEREGVFCRRVKVDYASHGPHMDPLRDELLAELEPIRPHKGSAPFLSTVTGALEDGSTLDAAYWWRNLREPVLFAPAIARLVAQGSETFLDVGPHALLVRAIEQCVTHAGREATVLPTLRRDEDERATLRDTLGALYVRGAPVAWSRVQRIELPPASALAALGLTRLDAPARPATAIEPALLALSAHGGAALTQRAADMAAFLREHPEVPLVDVCSTAGARRSHLEHRVAIVASGRAEAIDSLEKFARGELRAGVFQGSAPPTGRGGLVFVFAGHGSQWLGMGRQLFAEERVFRATIEACDVAIRRDAGFSVIEEIHAAEARTGLGRVDIVQPLLFATEVALAALWRSRGVEPDCVIGHSMGEVAAAHFAEILSLEDAVKVICRRSRLLQRVSGKGAMALVELALEEAEKALIGYEDRLGVAVSNGPRSTVISGDPGAIEEVIGSLEKQGIFCRRGKVDVAFHSPQMDPLREELFAALREIRPGPARIAMRSTVTGELVEGPELDAAYWVRNLRAPVMFSRPMQQLITEGTRLFVEISPHPILLAAIEENLSAAKQEGIAVASLRRNADERRTLLEGFGALYVHGYLVDWARLHPEGGRLAPLPTYPWQRERFWIDEVDGSVSQGRRAARAEIVGHPLLGTSFSPSLHAGERCWEQRLSVADLPYLADHRVQGEVVFPGAGYLEMALAAGTEVFGPDAFEIAEMRFERMLALPPGAERRAQVTLTDERTEDASLTISSRADGEKEWTRHALSRLRVLPVSSAPAEIAEPLSRIQARCAKPVEASEHYERMVERGLIYGPQFQGVEQLWTAEDEALGRVRVPHELSAELGAYQIHPALLDACLQMALELLPPQAPRGTFVPVGVARTRRQGRLPTEVWVHVRRRPDADTGARAQLFDLKLLDEHGRVLLDMDALEMAPIEGAKASGEDAFDDCLYEVVWRLEALPTQASSRAPQGSWLVLCDAGGSGAAVAARLRERGEVCVEAQLGTSYERLDERRWQIDPASPKDLDRLLTEAFGKQDECRGVVHCASLDAASWQATTGETLLADLGHGSLLALGVAQALLRRGSRNMPRLVLVTRGAQAVGPRAAPLSVAQAPLWGLGRTIALEHPELECTRIDLPASPLPREADLLALELVASDGEDQIALREEGRFAARLVRSRFSSHEVAGEPLATAAGRPFRLEIRKPGALTRLSLREITRCPPAAGEIEIEVEAAGLTFPDVLLALGVLPDDAAGVGDSGPRLGIECAGRIASVGEGVFDLVVGQEVLALTMSSMGTHTIARRELVAPRPALLSWEEAATLPVAFLTAYYALAHIARLQKGERVLIHAGAGGVGMAAIQWAQHVGAEVFTTVGSPQKRELLRAMGVEHIMDSRSLSFVEEVRRATNGEGVDVVLNSLSGELMLASFGLLRDYGRFVEIGKRDYYNNKNLALRPFLRNLSFSLVDVRGMMHQRPALVARLLAEVVELFASGALRPLPCEVFSASRAGDAFDLMARANHVGKLAIRMRDPEARIAPYAVRDGAITADGSYLITGGLGGLGLSLAQWMVSRGARHLALAGRSAPSAAAEAAIRAMQEAGAVVTILRGDVSKPSDVQTMLAQIEDHLPPLRGIAHAAGVLDDRTLVEIGEKQFWTPMLPKVLGAWNLHVATRQRQLDFFLMYSSIAALIGSRGQAAYAAGNAFLDALAHARAAEGLPAMSVQWGPFSEVGLATMQENRGGRLSHQGIESFTVAEGTAILSKLLRRPRAEIGVLRFSLRRWLESHPQAAGMRFLTELESEQAKPPRVKRGIFQEALTTAEPGERLTQLQDHVIEQLGRVLQLEPSRVDRRAPFTSLGVDSLMSLELRNRLESSLGLQLSAALLFTHPTPTALAAHLMTTLYPVSPPQPTPSVSAAAKPGEDLESLGADELLAMLDEELSLTRKNARAT